MATTNERLRNAVLARTVRLLRFDLDMQNRMSRMLRSVRNEIMRDLRIGGPGSRTANQISRKTQALAQAEGTIKNGFDAIKIQMTNQLVEIAALENEFAGSIINRQANVDLITTEFSQEQLEAAVNFAKVQTASAQQTLAAQGQAVSARYKKIIASGVIQGKTNQELVKEVGQIFDLSNRELRTLVRTSVQTVANDARVKTWTQNSNVVRAIQQVSTLDDRTTLICTAYSGKVWRLPDFTPVGHDLAWNGGPPRHYNCRSVTIPIVVPFSDLGLDVDEPDAGRRAAKVEDPNDPSSLIGTDVPADITFDDFLNQRSETFQNNLLGPTRADLFRRGKINTTDLVNANGEPLTIKELKTKKGITDVDDD